MKNLGFTLIELLIAIVIIGILGTISYPIYSKCLVKMRRTYAMTALMDLAGKMEEHYALYNTYNNATIGNINSYRIYPIVTGDTYVLHADPLGKQAKADALCGSLILDQSGSRDISGNGSAQECWR